MAQIKYNSEDVKSFGILGAIYLSNLNNLSETGLSEDDIIKLQAMFDSLGIIRNNILDKELYNYYRLNSNSKDLIDALKDKKKKKDIKKQHILSCLYNSFVCNNPILKEEMKKWINVVIEKYGYMSKECVLNFKHSLDVWAKGDVDKAIDIVKLATSLGYREFSWVLNKYNSKQTTAVRTTKQNRATLDDIDTTITF